MSGRKGGNSALDIRRTRRPPKPEAKPEPKIFSRHEDSRAFAAEAGTVYLGVCLRCESAMTVSHELKFGIPTYTIRVVHEKSCPDHF